MPFFLIAGLPRSGSTLLCNLLAQRDDSLVTPTSSLVCCLDTIRANWRQWHMAAPVLGRREKLISVLRNVVKAYHPIEELNVFDKSRLWHNSLDTMLLAFPDLKVLAPVRPIPQILASFEKLWRKNSPYGTVPNPLENSTVISRTNNLLAPNGVVGQALSSLQELKIRNLTSCIFPVKFENLTSFPAETLFSIELFLGLPRFSYDFNHVKQLTHENDDIHGFSELHTIRQKVAPVEDDSCTILGPDLHSTLLKTKSWWE